jgi:hypothetical protein
VARCVAAAVAGALAPTEAVVGKAFAVELKAFGSFAVARFDVLGSCFLNNGRNWLLAFRNC